MRRVAVTGLGAVSALGIGVQPLWDGLLAARSGVRLIRGCDTSRLLSPLVAAEVPDFDPERLLPDARLDLIDRCTQFALTAAIEAVNDSGLSLTDEERTRAGANIGTALGSAGTNDEAYLRFYGASQARIRPLTIPRLMHNASASQVSMMFGLQGPTACHSTACAASSHAIGEAGEIIRAGRADVMLAGGADASIVPGALTAWEAMRLLAPAGDDPSRACRPFSGDRMGLVLGEGAGVLVLEEWERARRRGARIYAELAGYGATADAGHITQPGVEAPARAIAVALAQARLDADAVGYVNAHGTGTRLNDATETRVLVEAFGRHAPGLAISSTKSMHGHVMGASGAIELIATVLAVKCGILPPTAHYTGPDPECHLDYVPNTARERQVDAALSNSFAFGGLNAVLIVRRV